jgi:hypothetical protein
MEHTERIYLAGVSWSGGFSSAWNSFITWVPRFIGFLAIVVIGWIVAKVIGKAVEKALRRVGFERVMQRAGVDRYLQRGKYDASKLVGKIVQYVLVLIVLQIAFGVFGSNPISRVIEGILAWIPRGLVAVAIVVVTAIIARGVRDLVANSLAGLSYGRVLANMAAVFILALGAIAALGQAGIATAITGPLLTAALATMAGVIIVGVGGGLIRPMQARWERMLDTAEREAGHMIGAANSGAMSPGAAGSPEAYAAGRSDAAQAAEEAARQARQNPPTSAM